MGSHSRVLCVVTSLLVLFSALAIGPAETFRVATYNLEGYLDAPVQRRGVKSAAAKAKIQECIRVLKPDVLALQEIGTASALLELRDSLMNAGLDLPYWEHVAGFDTNIHLAILSRFPFSARRSHTNDNFLLSGRRYRVSRGFGEVLIQVNSNYSFTLLTAHLKSKLTAGSADESELRLEEAKLLREKIDARLDADPNANLVVLGDFNDTRDSPALKAIVGRGKHKLADTRPAERNGDTGFGSGPGETRTVTWTHYYSKEDTYRRIDFLLVSPGMAREWVPEETYVLAMPDWGVASDHRPIVATFEARER